MTLQAWLLHYPHVALGAMVGALYLSDCFVLSSARHLLGTSQTDGRILSLLSPGRVVIFRGKVLYLLPPLLPWRPVHRIALADGRPAPPPSVAPVTAHTTKAAGLLLLVATLGLVSMGARPMVTLSCLVVIYATGLASALVLRARLEGVGWLRVAQCTLCPPHALNLLRRSMMLQPPTALAHAVGASHTECELQRMRERVAPLGDVLEEPLPEPLASIPKPLLHER